MPEGRLSRLRPDDLSPEQHKVREAVVGGDRTGSAFALTADDGSLLGPFNAMVVAPSVGHALQALGAAIRFHTSLPDRSRELAVLTVAAHWRSAFEWDSHVRIAAGVGLTHTEVEVVGGAADVDVLADEGERIVVRTVRRLLEGDLDDGEYASAVAAVGEAGTVELTTLVGYYALLALQLRVFRVDDAFV